VRAAPRGVGRLEKPKPSRRGLLEDGELVAEGQDLRFEVGASSEAEPNRRKERRDARPHDRWTLSGATGKLNRCKPYRISGWDRTLNH
jgi:hypothetical protein